MAVRFRDTNIWDEDWYVELGCEMQHLWDYICDKCDHAGIWRPNKSGFEMRAKTKVNLDSFFQKVNGDKERIFRLKDGNWFLTGAIQFQWFNKKKNGFDLVLTNKLHESIFKSLEKHDVPLKKVRGLKEVLQTSKEREKDLISNTDQGIGVSFEKSENLFFGDVPDDLIELSGTLLPTEKADQWHNYVEKEIRKLGYVVNREVAIAYGNNEKGRLDLVAIKPGIEVAIELDYRTPREKSIAKVKKYAIGMVLLRDPKIVEKRSIVSEMFDTNLPEKLFQEYFSGEQSWFESVAKNNSLTTEQVRTKLKIFLKEKNDAAWLPGREEHEIKKYFLNCIKQEKKGFGEKPGKQGPNYQKLE